MHRIELHANRAAPTLVTAALIPPFNTLPDVIVWGTRSFVRDPHASEQDPSEPFKYIEAFCYTVPTPR
jgi:hypothetical protein